MDFFKFLKDKAIKDGVEKFVTGSIITNKEGKILILTRKQDDDFLSGYDELPGGNANIHEGIYETLIRETKEETNFDTKKVISYVNYFDYLSRSGKKSRQFTFVLECENLNELILTEHDTYKWQSVDECLDNPKISDEVKETIIIYGFNKFNYALNIHLKHS